MPPTSRDKKKLETPLYNTAGVQINPATEEKQDELIALGTSGATVVKVKNVAGTTINPATEEKQDDIIAGQSSLLSAGTNQKTAFDELLVAELTPIIQSDFSYNINTEIWEPKLNGGTATVDSNRLKLSTGAAANQSARLESRIPVKYHPGQGALCRFTAVFSTPAANSDQYIGVGDGSDGLGFRYNGTTFGVCRRYGGSPEIRTLTITTKSTTAENITVTLNGDADATVAVTDATATDTTTTANEIAAHDFSGLGTGWKAVAVGSTVIFISYESAVKTGTYSVTGITVVGTFAQTVAGVAPTDEFIAQASWSEDQADGTGTLPVMDWTKGNVFSVRYQWLGYGAIKFYVENPSTGKLVLVHIIEYANANLTPSINNPTLPLCATVANGSNTSDIIMYSASMGAFTEGEVNGGHVHYGISATKTGITTKSPVLTIHNKLIYQGRLNRTVKKIKLITVATEGTKTVKVRLFRNATLTGASFTDISTNTSTVSYDVAATAVTGGNEELALGLAKTDSDVLDLAGASVTLIPGDFLTITGESASSVDITASDNWEEGF